MPPAHPTDVSPALEQRWRSRPTAARAVQLFVLAVPIAASVGCAALVSAALPHAHHFAAALGWWALVIACSTLTLFAVDRLARRLLPLALLLRLALVFPDQAPKRFRLAARSWSSRKVREQVVLAKAADASAAPADAATQLIGLLAGLAAHDPRTRGHCERVRAYNDLIADELGLSEADRDRLRWAALIHDIGKIKVSRRLLNKPGKPTDREWEELRKHPIRGAELAAPLAEWLGPWSLAIAQHHEHWDGTGYPEGLSGEDISLGARIVGVADAFEVMTSPRPYKKPMSAAAAREELASCAGTHFDPHVVRALLNVSLGRLRRAMGPIALFAQVPLLASMPQLSAALIATGQQAAVGASGAIGVVTVASVTATASHAHVVHQAVHHETPVVQSSAAAGPLAGVLAFTGAQPTATPSAAVHGKSHLVHGQGVAANPHAQAKGQAQLVFGPPTHAVGAGQTVAATKQHHGQAPTSTAPKPISNTTAAVHSSRACSNTHRAQVDNRGRTLHCSATKR